MHAFLGDLALRRKQLLLLVILLLLVGCNRSAALDLDAGDEASGDEIVALSSQVVVSFTLINADTNRPIRGFNPVRSGAVIDLSALPTTRLNIRANTNPRRVGSVRFRLNRTSNYRTDSGAPYSLAGDSGGSYRPWTPAPGRYTLTATPYSRANARGGAGKALTITFEVKGAQKGSGGLKWTTAQPAPLGVTEAQGLALGDKLYVFGGYTSWSPRCTSNEARVYDAAKNTWSSLPDMPEPWTHAGAASDGRNIFLVGGYLNKPNCDPTEVATRQVYRFDTQKQSWHRDLPPLPAARGSGGLAYLNGALHFFGGTDNKRADMDDHWVLAPGAKRWTRAAALPVPRSHMGVAVYEGKIYAIGGQKDYGKKATMLRVVHAYDPQLDRWTARASLPRPLSHITAATVIMDGHIVVIGGERSHNSPVTDVLAYDPARNRWRALTPLPARSRAGVAGVVGDKVVYSGGHRFVKQTYQTTLQ